MTTYTAELTREGKFWLITIEGVGVTQALNLGEVDEMATSLVEIITEEENPTIEVVFADGFPVDVTGLRRAGEALAKQQAFYSSALRDAVKNLNAASLTGADIARALQISPQRVSQLANEVKAPTSEALGKAAREAARKASDPLTASGKQAARNGRINIKGGGNGEFIVEKGRRGTRSARKPATS